MAESFLTFQKFNDEQVAEELITMLTENGLLIEKEDNHKYFDPTFAANPLSREILVKLRPADFAIAQKIVEAHYKNLIETVEEDYYLFDFSDKELKDILLKPDEWGDFDYQLSQKILKDRGDEINPDVVEHLKKQRNDELSRPETSNSSVVIIGYISAFAGGLIGIFIGWHLSYSKKTLPDGRSVNKYTEKERNHGTRILLIGTLSLVTMLLIRYFTTRS